MKKSEGRNETTSSVGTSTSSEGFSSSSSSQVMDDVVWMLNSKPQYHKIVREAVALKQKGMTYDIPPSG